jgi:hypothetical protein
MGAPRGRAALCPQLELSEDEAAYAFRRLEETIHDAAGHLGGMIKRRETEGSGSDDNT